MLGMLCLAAWAGGCGDDDDGEGTGSVAILLDAEDTITEGIAAGDEVEEIADGWSATFERYLAAVGHVHIHLATDEDVTREIHEAYVVDLTTVGTQGLVLWEIDGLSADEWGIAYETPSASEDGVMRHESVEEDDFDEMVAADATHLIEGMIEKDDGMSCPPASLAEPGDATADGTNAGGDPCYDNPQVAFRFLASAETTFDNCEVDGMPGFSVPDGGSTSVSLTLHGDHMFFNGFPDGQEGGIMRLAQWLADCDLDLDGEVTRAELEAIAVSDLSEIDDRYDQNLPEFVPPLEGNDLWTYLRAQLKTQGHIEGEGECQFDGVGHHHDEDGHDEDEHDHDEDEHEE